MSTVLIRDAKLSDAPRLLEIYSYYVKNTAITFEYEPPTSEEFAARMRSTLAFYPYVVAELDGRPVGYAYASTFKGRPAYDWAVETSIYVARGHAGRGIGRALHDALGVESEPLQDLADRDVIALFAGASFFRWVCRRCCPPDGLVVEAFDQ